jgi:hypothetical protein
MGRKMKCETGTEWTSPRERRLMPFLVIQQEASKY